MINYGFRQTDWGDVAHGDLSTSVPDKTLYSADGERWNETEAYEDGHRRLKGWKVGHNGRRWSGCGSIRIIVLRVLK